jgi:hypothetical protein
MTKDKFWDRNRFKKLYVTPGIDPTGILAMFNRQDRRCANKGCRQPIKPFGRARAMDRTPNGVPYALLCKSCSLALSNMTQSPKRLSGLLDYLMEKLNASNT